jgi:hypothetical protein
VGPLKGFRNDKIPLSEIISRVGGQGAFDAAVLETILLRAMGDVSVCVCAWIAVIAALLPAPHGSTCAVAARSPGAVVCSSRACNVGQQVMPVHGANALPDSAKITSNIPKLMAAFDPAKPFTFEVGGGLAPGSPWRRAAPCCGVALGTPPADDWQQSNGNQTLLPAPTLRP